MNKKEVKKAPTLRFKGFTNDWEQRKLKDCLEINSGRDYKHLHSGNIPVFGTGGYMLSVDEALSYKNAIGIGRKGTIDKPQLLIAPFWTVDTLFFLTPENDTDLYFLFSFFQKVNWKKYDESTGLPSLSKKTISTIKIKTPSKNEQIKIGTLIQKVNNLISLQQRKLKLLKVMKKALSQYMFCQEIEFVPILRFNSFSDKWKYERLKNLIVKEIKGKAKADMKGTKSTYIDTALLNGGSITKVDSPTDTFHNDIIILWDGSQAGKIYHGFTGALGSTLKSYKPKYSGGFLYQYLKSKEPIIFLRYRTPNIPHVVKDFTEIFKINVPSVKEQEKISKTLNYLDQSILVETKKIGSIKKIKKFLLQNMFI